MRVPPSPPIILFLLTLISTTNAQNSSINDILQTDQYILLAQQNNQRFLEINVQPGKCPEVLRHSKSEYVTYDYIGLHLIRDPDGVLPPKVLTVAQDQIVYAIKIFSLNTSEAFEKQYGKTLESIDSKGRLHQHDKQLNMKGNNGRKLPNSIFDTTRHMLYLVFYYSGINSQVYDVEQYYILNIFSDKPGIKLIEKYNAKLEKQQHGWVEDPYSDIVYYKENIKNETILLEAPISDFIAIITGERSGKKSNMSFCDGAIQGVSSKTFYLAKISAVNETHRYLTSSVKSGKSGLEINCDFIGKTYEMPTSNKLIIIRNNDYCMLRDKANYSKESCEEEQKRYWALQNHTAEEEDFNIIKWLLICCIFLFAVVILLCVYVYWLRSTFVSADDRTLQNEYETEASLFIAKQRSFPTSYQDPALLDISVDKWN